MTSTVNNFRWGVDDDPACAFVATLKPDPAGFRRNSLNSEQWRSLLQRPDIWQSPHVAVERQGSDIIAIVVPQIRQAPLYHDNAFLHVFGCPSPRLFRYVQDKLTDDGAARFCQVLVPSSSLDACRTIAEAGGIHVEDEVYMTRVAQPGADISVGLIAGEQQLRMPLRSELNELDRMHAAAFCGDIAYSKRNYANADDADLSQLSVLLVSGEIVGLIEVVVNGCNRWIDCVAVTPSKRRQGYGHSMLCAALKSAVAEDIFRLNVSSRNEAARALYASFSFAEVYRDCRFVLV